jgi:hypothetical protein
VVRRRSWSSLGCFVAVDLLYSIRLDSEVFWITRFGSRDEQKILVGNPT